VRVDVPLADASQVYIGQSAEVVVDVLPDQTFSGEVTHVTHLADLQKNTLEVKVKVVDPSALLKPDMLARVRFLGTADAPGVAGNTPSGTESVTVVRVPAAGLVGGTVWVVRERRGVRGRVQPVGVQPIASTSETGSGQVTQDGTVAVRGALSVGDLIVVEPAGLEPNQPVRFTEPGDKIARADTMDGGGR
ncbi:MAG: efflux RND transporter periplasmic adaptor subunit, partial [Planctomycetota bacterium]